MQNSGREQLEQLERNTSGRAFCLWGMPGSGKSHALEGKLGPLSSQVLRFTPNTDIAWDGFSIVVLEDLHLIPDGESWALEQAAKLESFPSLTLWATHRSPLPAPFVNLEWPALNRLETDALLKTQLNAATPPEALEWIFTRTLGHPQFALEYVRYLSRQGFLWAGGERWRWRNPPEHFFPPTIEALVEGWTRPFAAQSIERSVLESAVLLPEQADEKLRAGVVEVSLERWKTACDTLEREGLLRETQPSHPLMGEAILRGLSTEAHTHYSRRILSALEAAGVEPTPALIGGARLDTSHTLNLYSRLTQEARSRGDLAQAGYWLASASEQAPAAQQATLALEAAHLLRHTDLERALTLAERAASSVPPVSEAVLLCAELDLERGDTVRAEGWLGLLSSMGGEAKLRVWELRLKLLHGAHPRHDEALDLWSNHPEFQRRADPETVLRIGSILGQRGQFEAAFALSGPLLERPHLTPFLRCRALEFQSTLHHLQGHLVSAETYGIQALSLARKLDRPSYLAKLLQKQHVTLVALDRTPEAEAPLREALELYRRHGPPLELAHTGSSLGKYLGNLGLFEEAETLLLESLNTLEKLDHAVLRCDAAIGLAALYLVWQPPYAGPLTLKYARLAHTLAEESANQQMLHVSLIYLANGEALYGDAKAALAYAQESALEHITGPSESRVARSQFVLGLALEASGQLEQARQTMQAALLEYERLGDAYYGNIYGLELDRLNADISSARTRFDWFTKESLLGYARRTLRYFPALEQSPPETIATPTQALEKPKLLLLGPTLLEREGKRTPYRGRKRLELLAYLLETRVGGRGEATLLELMDALYPGANEREARATLKQLAYLLRQQLGTGSILSTPKGYALGELESDVEDFLKTRNPALWRGPYLLDLEESGTPLVRDALLSGLAQLASHLLEGQPAPAQPAEAARLGHLWLEMEPYSLEALSLTLQAEQATGDPRAVKRTLQAARTRLLEVGQTLPDSLEGILEVKTI